MKTIDISNYEVLCFLLGEYLGMQSSKLDKESFQMLHEKVHDILEDAKIMKAKK